MRMFTSALVLLFSLSVHAALPAKVEWKKSQVAAAMKWEHGPVVGGNSRVTMTFSSTADRKPTEPPGGVDVSIQKLNSKENFQATVTKITDTEGKNFVGRYQVSDLRFTSAGTWEMKVTLKYPNQKEDVEVIRIDIPQK